jgi:hypothetical protein
MYFSLLYFIPCEWILECYNQHWSRSQLYNYAVLDVGGSGCMKLLSILNLILTHFTKAYFFTCRRGSRSFQRLNFRIDAQSTVKHEMKHFPLRVRSVFPTFFIAKLDSNLLIIFFNPLILSPFSLNPSFISRVWNFVHHPYNNIWWKKTYIAYFS